MGARIFRFERRHLKNKGIKQYCSIKELLELSQSLIVSSTTELYNMVLA